MISKKELKKKIKGLIGGLIVYIGVLLSDPEMYTKRIKKFHKDLRMVHSLIEDANRFLDKENYEKAKSYLETAKNILNGMIREHGKIYTRGDIIINLGDIEKQIKEIEAQII